VEGFTFESLAIDIHSCRKTPVSASSEMITAVFLSQTNERSADLLYASGTRLQHLRLTLRQTAIHTEVVRGGANFSGVLSWSYSLPARLLTFLRTDRLVLEIHVGRKLTLVSAHMCPPALKADLPGPLVLSPESMSRFSALRFVHNRIFTFRYRSKFCVVEQLFDGEEFAFVYTISKHSEVGVVTGLNPHYPACALQDGPVIVVFVPNRFVCFVDIAKPGRHFVFRGESARSVAGEFSAPIPIPHSIINIFTGRIYTCKIDLAAAAQAAGSSNPEFVAFCAARALSAQTVATLLRVFEGERDPVAVARTFREFFGGRRRVERCDCRELRKDLEDIGILDTIAGQIDQMEEDLPSAGEFSRTDYFWLALAAAARDPDKLGRTALKILEEQTAQDAIVRAVNEALGEWREIVPEMLFNMVAFVAAQFAAMLSFPRIPIVPDAMRALAMISDLGVREMLLTFFREERRVLDAPPKRKPEKTPSTLSAPAPDYLELELASIMSDAIVL
jgi:hypothetical protein